MSMTNDKRLPDIFTYFDFRKYLADFYRRRKELEPGFSHTYICHRLGQRNSKSYFANVVSGVKTVTAEFINRFVDMLELNAEESKYFRALVSYNQCYNPKEKEYYFDQLIQRNATQKRLISKEEYAFYKEWYHSVIRAILDIYDFNDDYEALAKIVRPPLTVRQVKNSIRLLESLNLIAKNTAGFFKPTDKTVTTEECVRDELIERYQIECLEIAKAAILKKDDQPQEITTNILSISAEGLAKVQNRLNKFREEVRALVQNDTNPADRVYQLDIQLFPNARLPASDRVKRK
jgi:uncharacterized protein (TIGR02147 family)